MYNVVFYKDENGRSEVEEYLLELKHKKDKETRIKLNKIIAYLNMLEKEGKNIGEPYIKHIEEDIWELRPLRDRILFAYWKDNKFIILSIFMKKTQKTPRKEIEKAKKNLKEFIKRSEENE